MQGHGRIVNVFKESKLDRLSTPWAMVQASRLCWQGTADWELEDAGGSLAEGGVATPEASQGQEIDEPVIIEESVKLGPFQPKS